LALDVFGFAAGLPLSSTGAADSGPLLVERPFRLWEYAWLYKVLGLASGQARVLDLGGPATHISVLAAIAGCTVTSIDINPEFVDHAQDVARILQLRSLEARVGDMRDLSGLPSDSFDCVMSCSVLEHLTGEDQQTALREMARVLKPGGAIGLTFDFGEPAPGQNEYLPPPHEPPRNAKEALQRYVQGGLTVEGNAFCEDPVPRSLFRDQSVSYTVAALFLTKAPGIYLHRPQPCSDGSAWSRLVIAKLPNRLYANPLNGKEELMRLRETVQKKEDEIRRLSAELSEREAALQAASERAEALDTEAKERLKEMLVKEEILQRLNKHRIFIRWR
jgi:SAM-dependent methyltransferase